MAAELRMYYDGHLINFSSSNGYPTICVVGKNILLHRYVWMKYHGEIPRDYQVHHKDGNKLNWSIENLELVPTKEHSRHHAIKKGLGKKNKGKVKHYISGCCPERHPVIAIKGDVTIKFDSISDAVRELKVHSSSIWRIFKGQRKSAKGWVFVDGK